jgi:hypothetical protein
MKTFTFKFLALISLLLLLVSTGRVQAQCGNSSTGVNNNGTLTPPCGTNSSRSIGPGEVLVFNVNNGNTYTFQTCGGATWDTYLTLYNSGGGAALAQNDDGCSTQSTITYQATFTGTVRLLLTRWAAGTACNYWQGGGTGNSATVLFQENLPSAPALSPNSQTYCGSSYTLPAPGSGIAGETAYWQGTNSTGTSTGLGTPTYSTVGTTTYYIRSRSTGGCWGPASAFTATLNTPSSGSSGITLASGTQVQCNATPASITLNANVATVGTSGTIQWYSDGTCTTPLSTGTQLSFTPNAATTTTRSVRVTGACNSPTTCQTYTATHNTSTTGSSGITLASGTQVQCSAAPSSITLDANVATVGTSGTIQWYSDGTCTTPVSTGTQHTYTPTASVSSLVTTLRSVRVTGACNSPSTCVNYSSSHTLASTGSSGVTLTSGIQNQCSSSPSLITLNANVSTIGVGGTVQWYLSNNCTGTALSTGTTINVTPSANTSTSWSVRVNGACNSPTSCQSYTATHNTPTSGSSGITLSSGTQTQCNATPTSLTLNANVATVGTGGTIQWYSDGTCSTTLSTGSTATVTPTANTSTTWSVRVTGACNGSSTCQTYTASHQTSSTGSSGITLSSGTQNQCSASPTSITLAANVATVGLSGTIQWYTGSSCATTLSTGATVNVTPTANTSTSWSVRVTGACNSPTTCQSYTATHGTPASGPTSISSSNGTDICAASPTTNLTAQTFSLGSNPTGAINWYLGAACGGASQGTGTLFAPTLSANTTASFSAQIVGACNASPGCVSISITTRTPASGPTSISSSNGTNICNASPTTTLTANSVSLGANPAGTVNWYLGAACGGSSQATGTTWAPTLSTNTTASFSARITGACNSPACQSITITTRTPSSGVSAVNSSNGTDICNGTTTTDLSATVSTLGDAGVITWYLGSCGSGGSIGTGTPLTVTPAANTSTTYGVRVEGACNSPTACQFITITTRTPSSGPTSVSSSNGTDICSASPSTTLTANGAVVGANPAGTINWYATSNCTGAIQSTGATWAPTLTANSTASYSAQISGACGASVTPCQSVTITTRTPATNPTAIISSAGLDICNASPTTDLTATGFDLGGNPAGTINWYVNNNCSGGAAATGSVYSGITVPANTTTSYSVNITGACNTPTACQTVSITTRTPTTGPTSISSSNGTNICTGSPSTVLTAVGAALGANPTGSIDWYLSNNCTGSIQATGTTWSPTLVNGATTDYSVRANGGCNGATTCQTIAITSNVISTDPVFASTSPTAICSNASTNVTLTLSGGSAGTGAVVRWYSGSCGGTLVGTGNPLTIAQPLVTTTYFGRFEGNCNTTNCQSALFTIDQAPTVNAGADIAVCTGTSAISMAGSTATGAYTSVSWTGGSGLGVWTFGGTNPAAWTFIPSVSNGSFTATLDAVGNFACLGTNPSDTRVISWNVTPSAAGTITGPATACNGAMPITFNISSVANANDYLWAVPTGASYVSGSGTTNIELDVTSVAPGTYSVTVTPRNTNSTTCSGTISPTFTLVITGAPVSDIFTGTANSTWFNNSNWQGDCVPTCGVSVTIDGSTYTNAPVVSGTSLVKDITLVNGGNLTLNSSAILRLCGDISGTGTIAANSLSEVQFNGGTTQNVNVSFTSGGVGALGNVTITNSGTSVVLGSGVTGFEANNFTIGNGSNNCSFNASGKPLTINGSLNVTSNASLTLGSGSTVTFGGFNNATFTANGSVPTFENVVINKTTSQLSLANNLSLSGTLSLNNGVVSTASNFLRVTNDATSAISGGSATAHVLGNLDRALNSAGGDYLWPVGNGSEYFPATLGYNYTGEVADYSFVRVNYSTGDPGSIIPTALDTITECGAQSGYKAILTHGSWDVSGVGSGSSAGKYDLLLASPSTSYTPCVQCSYTIVTRADMNPSTPWSLNGTCEPYLSLGTAAAVRRLGMTTFSGKGIGATGSGDPFPIELISFTASPEQNSVNLEWVTGSEKQNRGFELQRGTTATNLTPITFVNGAGDSNIPLQYRYTDRDLQTGKTYYYRLRQVDFDGQFKYSNTIEAVLGGTAQFSASLYPNPTSGDLSFKIEHSVVEPITLVLTNTLGQEVFTKSFESKIGTATYDLNINELPSGTYQVQIASPSQVIHTRILKIKN